MRQWMRQIGMAGGMLFTLSLGGASVGAATPLSSADSILPVHGQYTQTYMSDWSSLPTGDQLARRDPQTFQVSRVEGSQARRVWRHQPQVRLSDLQLEVKWNRATPDKTQSTLYFFEGLRKLRAGSGVGA